jgi:hypothetical protein
LTAITAECETLIVSLEVKMETYRHLNGRQFTVNESNSIIYNSEKNNDHRNALLPATKELGILSYSSDVISF